MWSIITYMSESLICGAFLYMLYALLVNKERSYTFQRLYILISIAAITLFPLIDIPLGFNSPLDFRHYLEPAVATAEGNGESAGLSSLIRRDIWSLSFTYLYIAVSTIYILFIAVHLMRIYRIYKNSTRAGFGKYTLVCSSQVEVPFSFMNTIFIGDQMIEHDREYVINHEFSHITRGHSFDILIVNIINIIQWFNPFIYIFKRSLIETHEYQADRDVLTRGGSLVIYRKLLLNSQFGLSPYLSNSLNKSLTLKRFKKMENLEQKRAGVKAVSATLLLLSILFTLVSFTSADGTALETKNTKEALISQVNSDLSDTTKRELPFMQVEEKPKFMGGDENTFTRWVAERLVYPPAAKKDSVQGRVILQFKVDEKGDVGSVKVVRGVDKRLDEEAIRVVSSSPAWSPGKDKGKAVTVVYVFPVIFKLR